MQTRRGWMPVWVALVVMAAGALLGSRVEIDNDVSRLLPDATPDMARATSAFARLTDRTIVDIGPGEHPVSLPELGRIADDFAARLRATGQVTDATSRIDTTDAVGLVALLRERAALLIDEAQLRQIEMEIQPDRVIETVQRLAQRIQEIDGAMVKARAAIDPLGLTDRVLAPLAALGEGFRDSRIIDGRITSADGEHVLVIVPVGFAATDIDRSKRYLATLRQIIGELSEDPENHGVRICHLGAHRSTLDNVEQIQHDVILTSGIGAVAVAVLTMLCFGRLWLSLLALLPAVFGGVVAWGAFSLFSDSMSGAVLGFGAVLLGLTIDFAIHVLFRIERGNATTRLPVRALYMGGTTTSLAFLALLASSLPAVREVGIFGAIGIFVAMLFALYVLPRIAPSPRHARPVVDLQELVEPLARPAMPAIVVASIATPVIALGVMFLEFDGDPTNLSAIAPDTLRDQSTIEGVWGDAELLTTLVVEVNDLTSALAANDRLGAWLDTRAAAGDMRTHASISRLLPGLDTQRRRRDAWRAFWSEDRIKALHAALKQATDRSPFHEGAFEPFVRWLEKEPELLSYAEQRDGPMRTLLRDRVFHANGVWQIMTPVFTDDWEQTATLDRELSAELPDITFLNKQAFARKLASMVTGEVFLLAVLAFLMVGTIVFIWHGRVVITLVILLPLLLSFAWTLGLLGWLGIPISLANAIFVVFLFGVAVDYAIFLATSRLDHYRTGEDHTKQAQASVLLCTLTTCGGFGALVAAGHPVMHAIGMTALIGIASAALVTQIFVPAMARGMLRRGGPNGTPGVPNILGAAHTLWTFVGGGLWHLVTRRRGDDQDTRRRAAIASIHRMSVLVRDKSPIGRRRYVDLDKLLEDPCILVANHESMYDIAAVLALEKPVQVLVKRWVWEAPVMGAMVRDAGYPVVHDTDPGAVLANVRESIGQNISVLVFPEGKRTRTGRMGRFHNGAFAMARQLGVKVQPIAMVNTREVVPIHCWWAGDHDPLVAVLDPMDPHDFAGEGGDRRMAREARDRVRERCRELWLETQNGPLWHRTVSGMYRYLGPLISHYAVSKCKRDPLIRELPALCGGTGRILVAGGGFGLMTARLALAYPERPITCVDSDGRKTGVARAALGDRYPVDFLTADLRETALPGVSMALLVDVLHYWDAETQEAILRRVADALEAGGRLLFRDGCARAGKRHAFVFALERLAVVTGFTRGSGEFLFRTEAGWRELLSQCGFAVEESRPELGSFSNVVFLCRRAN